MIPNSPVHISKDFSEFDLDRSCFGNHRSLRTNLVDIFLGMQVYVHVEKHV